MITPAIAFAGIVEDLKSKITDTSDQVKNIEKEIAAYNAKLKATQSEKDSLKKAITTLDINKQIISKDLNLTQNKIEVTNKTLIELDNGIGQLNNKISTNKVYLKKSIQNMATNESYSKPDLITTLLASDSISEAFDTSAALANFQDLVYSMSLLGYDTVDFFESLLMLQMYQKLQILSPTLIMLLLNLVLNMTRW
jgi:septal ring factor EnvC (AmiA/AmiB activator)